MKSLLYTGMVAFLFVSCSNNSGQLVDKSESSNNNTVSQSPSTSSTPSLPVGHPPIGQVNKQAMDVNPHTGGARSATVDGNLVSVAGLSFTISPDWQNQPPSSMMRAAQFVLPSADGDSTGGELVLFQGIGGSAQMNIDRWIGQFKEPEYKETTNKTINGLQVYVLDIAGTFNASMGPMMRAQAVDKAGYGMLAAVVEGNGGPWHFKLTGPKATIEKWKPNFMELVDSLQPAN